MDNVRYSLLEQRDKRIFQFSVVYSDLVTNVTTGKYSKIDEGNFYKIYLEVFDKVDDSVRNTIASASDYIQRGKESDFEGTLFSKLKFEFEHLHLSSK
ncbi:hypothetical protein GL177_00030 [Vibrio toranzoniae]|uniref:hypothetical protein n=1 Tax=Vibrio toranzoniae TaxID=1194427 RepID=UPI001377D321|nr:hypothetical protein [Vibrio toranzoniae]NAZ51757.1 hypothetical protein [Vibrio toranzoniae]